MPEGTKGMGCKPIGIVPSEVRILPPPGREAGVAQMEEHQPSKLVVAGSSPVSRWGAGNAHVAQPEERFLGKEEVTGSIPVMGWREKKKKIGG